MFDDLPAIRDNPTIRQMLPLAVPLHPPSNTSVAGRPLVNLTLAADVALGARIGLPQRPPPGTTVFHAVNLVLHLLCGALLLVLVRDTLRVAGLLGPDADMVAFAVAAIWLVHPLQSEAVDYLTQRTELLVSMCYLLAMWASARAWDASSRRTRRSWLALGCVAALLGAASKEVIVTLPVVLILYDRAFRADRWSTLWRNRERTTFYVALAAIIAGTFSLVGAGSRSGTAGFSSGMPWYEYAYTQAWAIARYLRLTLWPVGLNYDYGQQAIHGMAGVPGLIVVAVLASATAFAWTRERWRRMAFVGAAFLLLLAPSSSVVPIRTEVAAERRMYLALALVIVAIVVAVRHLALRARVGTTPRTSRIVAVGALAAVVLVLSFATRQRSALYANPEALWRDAVQQMPANARAHDNLAYSMLQADSTRTADAEREFRRAIEVDSTYLPAWTNLADVELRAGRRVEAKTLLEQVLAREPRYIDAQARLGEMLAKSGDVQRAMTLLEPVVASAPTDESLLTLGSVYVSLGRMDDALRVMQQGVALNPGRADALAWVGGALLERQQPDVALPYLERATALGERSRLVLALLSLAYAELGRADAAVRVAAAASEAPAEDDRADITLGRAMLVIQRPDEAASFFQRAADAAPNDPEPPTRLAITKAAAGQAQDAERLLQRVIAKWPSYAPAVNALERVRSQQHP